MGLIVPYWINELLRIFAWQLILADAGILNKLLLVIGIIAEPINFRAGNRFACTRNIIPGFDITDGCSKVARTGTV